LVFLGAFFDLFDGFFARLLDAESEFGLQFDSMADLITSGVVPGVVMYNLFLENGVRELNFSTIILQSEFTFSFAPLALVGFLIPLSAGIRLARFNIDKEQQEEFKGLPAPANALFIVALPLLIEHPIFESLKEVITSYSTLVIITLLSAILMNVRLPLFSFKIKSLSFQEYQFQWILLLLSLPMFYFFNWVAVPLLILIYLILNVIRNSTTFNN
jgi:CDP-diacylglycerol--serine O-phosphatidyltransferase